MSASDRLGRDGNAVCLQVIGVGRLAPHQPLLRHLGWVLLNFHENKEILESFQNDIPVGWCWGCGLWACWDVTTGESSNQAQLPELEGRLALEAGFPVQKLCGKASFGVPHLVSYLCLLHLWQVWRSFFITAQSVSSGPASSTWEKPLLLTSHGPRVCDWSQTMFSLAPVSAHTPETNKNPVVIFIHRPQ